MKELIKGTSGRWILVSLLAMVVGFACWIAMLNLGLLGTTGLGNIFNWGMLICVFAFLVGFGAGGQLVASYAVLSGREGLTKFALPAQAFGLAGAVGAAVAVVIDLGQPFHIFSMLIHPNLTSPLVWDMVALTAFIVVAFVGMFALARDWKSKRAWMIAGVVTAVALQLVEGLLFATQGSRAWWHSYVMPLDFLVVACVCGLALICVICALSKGPGALEAGRSFAGLLFWAVIIHVVLALTEMTLLAFEGGPGAEEVLGIVFRYGALYALELLLPLGAAIALKVRLGEANSRKLTVCGVLVIIGMFCHRLMLLIPALSGVTLFTWLSNEPSPAWGYPISTGYLASAQQTFALSQAYVPGVVECLSLLLPLGLAVLIAIVGYKLARS